MQQLKQTLALIGGDPYDILQSKPQDEMSLIRKNFRNLALKYHPDRNKSQEAIIMFLKITRAYQFVQNDDNRKLYINHHKAVQENKKRVQNMSAQRKKYNEDLQRRQQQYRRSKNQMEEELKKKKEFYNKKMQEEEEREEIRKQIKNQMNPQTFYEDVSSILIQWENGLSFNQFLLENALKAYAKIQKIQIQSKRRKAKVVFSSIEACTNIVRTFNHPLIKIKTFLPLDRRNHLLKALEMNKKTEIDFTLNSQTISRLKNIVNRSSNLYTSNIQQM